MFINICNYIIVTISSRERFTATGLGASSPKLYRELNIIHLLDLVDIVMSQPLLCLYLWFRIAIGGSPNSLRGRRGQAARLSLYPRGDMSGPFGYTSQARSRLVPCNWDRGRCFPWLVGSTRSKVLFVTIPEGFRCNRGSVQSPAVDPRDVRNVENDRVS